MDKVYCTFSIMPNELLSSWLCDESITHKSGDTLIGAYLLKGILIGTCDYGDSHFGLDLRIDMNFSSSAGFVYEVVTTEENFSKFRNIYEKIFGKSLAYTEERVDVNDTRFLLRV